MSNPKGNIVIPAFKLFDKYFNPKKPPIKVVNIDKILIYLAHRQLASFYLYWNNEYHSFISLITRFYPFSLLYEDRLFHAQNIPIRNFMEKLDKIGLKSGFPIYVLSGKKDDQLTEFYGYFTQKVKDRQISLKAVEKVLQEELQAIYVRDDGDKFKILVPTEYINKEVLSI